MSRAFTKEPDAGAPDEPLPERPISEHPNYVTPHGLHDLQRRVDELGRRRAELLEALDGSKEPAAADEQLAREELRHVDRDLRYYVARADSAILIDAAGQPTDEVAFGATVTVAARGDAPGHVRTYTIVGEDEADPEAGTVSYISPLAKALLGTSIGQTVVWRRPAGDLRLTVRGIQY